MPRQSKKKISKTIHEHAHSQGVYSISADNWEKLYGHLQKIEGIDDYVWRGHKLSSWKLLPTLYRGLDPQSLQEEIQQLQLDQLARFERACIGRRGPNPRDLKSEQWWAIGQHNGLMTPLLDWTRSPFVATYFAFWKPKTDGSNSQRVIYGLNRSKIIEAGLGDALRFIEPLTDENSRLLSQAGLFTLCEDIKGIETWVRKNF